MVGGDCIPDKGKTLLQFVREIQSMNPGVKLTLALEGLETSLRYVVCTRHFMPRLIKFELKGVKKHKRVGSSERQLGSSKQLPT